MLRHNLLLIYRNFKRFKSTFLINLIGLSTGMACSILILLWVQDELSYDSFNENADCLYRITADISGLKAAIVPAPLAEALKAELPEVKNVTRLSYGIQKLFEVENSKYQEKAGFFADPSFLEMFSFPLVKGDAKLALSRPDGILITEAMAKKHFRKAEALDKTILLDNKDLFVVTGILKDLPLNSHLQFDFLLPMAFLAKTDDDIKNSIWDNFSFYTYIQLDENFSVSPSRLFSLKEKINDLYKKNESLKADFELQPLKDIHLHSNYLGDVEGHGNVQYVRIFSVAAAFILLVACINFMNLSTAHSGRRAKEVGVRKVIGANRKELIRQFFDESILISFLALALSIILVILLLPAFHNFTGKMINLNFSDGRFIWALFTIALFTGILAGSYPALFLSSFQPVKVLKGTLTKSGNASFRNGLVIVQFVISMVLIVSTTVIYKQLQFIKSQNLGFEKENLLYISLSGERNEYYNTLKTELQQNPLTNDFTAISDLPTDLGNGTTSVDWEGKDPSSQPIFAHMEIDERFIDVFKTELVSGRNFSKDFKADMGNYILNEKALQVMGMEEENAIGQTISVFGNKGKVIGVARDFNFKPLHQSIEPLILKYNDLGEIIVVKSHPEKTEAAISALENIWQRTNPSHPFAYSFVDQDLANLYQAEQHMGSLFKAFAVLAIFISCLGLYGLAAFTAEQRTKEIGIRKTLGASKTSIVKLLALNLGKPVFVAMVVSLPLSHYLTKNWLDNFAYKIGLEWWYFLGAGLIALLVAWLTVGTQAIKASRLNPVDCLKDE